jgi:hypothetical protein
MICLIVNRRASESNVGPVNNGKAEQGVALCWTLVRNEAVVNLCNDLGETGLTTSRK